MSSQTINWNHVYQKHAFNILSDGFADNAYEGRPLLKLLRERKINRSGGAELVERVNMGRTRLGGSYRKGSKTTMADVDPYDRARYTWAYYQEPVVIYFTDEHEASGTPDRLSLLEDKLSDAMESMMAGIAQDLCRDSKTNSTDVNTLVEAVSDAGTGAFGNLNPATAGQEAWVNQALTASTTWSTQALIRLRNCANLCSAGNKHQFDAVLVTQDDHETYLTIADDSLAINENAKTKGGTKVGDLGFQAASFQRRPIFWDPDWTTLQSGQARMLNFDGIRLIENPKHSFKLSPFQSTRVGGVNARVAWIDWVGQLTVKNRRLQGAIKTDA